MALSYNSYLIIICLQKVECFICYETLKNWRTILWFEVSENNILSTVFFRLFTL